MHVAGGVKVVVSGPSNMMRCCVNDNVDYLSQTADMYTASWVRHGTEDCVYVTLNRSGRQFLAHAGKRECPVF